MLDKERSVYFNVCRHLLTCVTALLLVLTQRPVVAEESSCTRENFVDQLRSSFKVSKLGHARDIRSCIYLCCSKNICDLALFENGRCFGISCPRHGLCRSITNGLRKRRHEISKRSTLDTEEFSSEFSHRSRSHGFCRQRRVIPHHVFIHREKGVSNFRHLGHNIMNIKKCNERCCEEKDCSLAFILQRKCYGVICPDDGDCNSRKHMRVPVHLEIALIPRKGHFSEAISNEKSFRKKTQMHHQKHKLRDFSSRHRHHRRKHARHFYHKRKNEHKTMNKHFSKNNAKHKKQKYRKHSKHPHRQRKRKRKSWNKKRHRILGNVHFRQEKLKNSYEKTKKSKIYRVDDDVDENFNKRRISHHWRKNKNRLHHKKHKERPRTQIAMNAEGNPKSEKILRLEKIYERRMKMARNKNENKEKDEKNNGEDSEENDIKLRRKHNRVKYLRHKKDRNEKKGKPWKSSNENGDNDEDMDGENEIKNEKQNDNNGNDDYMEKESPSKKKHKVLHGNVEDNDEEEEETMDNDGYDNRKLRYDHKEELISRRPNNYGKAEKMRKNYNNVLREKNEGDHEEDKADNHSIKNEGHDNDGSDRNDIYNRETMQSKDYKTLKNSSARKKGKIKGRNGDGNNDKNDDDDNDDDNGDNDEDDHNDKNNDDDDDYNDKNNDDDDDEDDDDDDNDNTYQNENKRKSLKQKKYQSTKQRKHTFQRNGNDFSIKKDWKNNEMDHKDGVNEDQEDSNGMDEDGKIEKSRRKDEIDDMNENDRLDGNDIMKNNNKGDEMNNGDYDDNDNNNNDNDDKDDNNEDYNDDEMKYGDKTDERKRKPNSQHKKFKGNEFLKEPNRGNGKDNYKTRKSEKRRKKNEYESEDFGGKSDVEDHRKHHRKYKYDEMEDGDGERRYKDDYISEKQRGSGGPDRDSWKDDIREKEKDNEEVRHGYFDGHKHYFDEREEKHKKGNKMRNSFRKQINENHDNDWKRKDSFGKEDDGRHDDEDMNEQEGSEDLMRDENDEYHHRKDNDFDNDWEKESEVNYNHHYKENKIPYQRKVKDHKTFIEKTRDRHTQNKDNYEHIRRTMDKTNHLGDNKDHERYEYEDRDEKQHYHRSRNHNYKKKVSEKNEQNSIKKKKEMNWEGKKDSEVYHHTNGNNTDRLNERGTKDKSFINGDDENSSNKEHIKEHADTKEDQKGYDRYEGNHKDKESEGEVKHFKDRGSVEYNNDHLDDGLASGSGNDEIIEDRGRYIDDNNKHSHIRDKEGNKGQTRIRLKHHKENTDGRNVKEVKGKMVGNHTMDNEDSRRKFDSHYKENGEDKAENEKVKNKADYEKPVKLKTGRNQSKVSNVPINNKNIKKYKQDKIRHGWPGEDMGHEPKQKSDEKDIDDIGIPHHKKSLYHSLKNLQENKGENKSKSKSDVESFGNSTRSSDSIRDVMNGNKKKYHINKNNKKMEKDETTTDPTKYFNQNTRGWEESSKGDDVDENGKYFNQVTRVWSTKKSNNDTNYFRKMTMDWDIRNNTQGSGGGNYFNQRTKNWMKGGNSQNTSKHIDLKPKQPHQSNHDSLKNVSKARYSDSDSGSLMNLNKIHEATENGTSKEDKKLQNYQKVISKTSHQVGSRKISVRPEVKNNGNTSQGILEKNDEVKHKKKETQKQKVYFRNQFKNPIVPDNYAKNNQSLHRVESNVNKLNKKNGQHLSKKKKPKMKDNKSAEENVKNEILKLIGQDMFSKTRPKKKKVIKSKPEVISHRKNLASTNHSNLNIMKNHVLPKVIPEQEPQKQKSVTFPQLHQNRTKLFKQPLHKLTFNNKNNVKTLKNTENILTKEPLKNTTTKKNRAGEKLLIKSNLVSEISEQKQPKSAKNVSALKPIKTIQVSNKEPQILKKPIVSNNPLKEQKTKAKANTSNKENTSKVLPNSFYNSWNSKEANRVPFRPTINNVQNWNKPNKVYENGWDYNGYPGQQGYGNPRDKSMGLPLSPWDNQQGNTVSNINNGHQEATIKTTPPPVYLNGELPSMNNGDNMKNGVTYGHPASLFKNNQVERLQPLKTVTPRRNYVTKTFGQNNDKLLPINQNGNEANKNANNGQNGNKENENLTPPLSHGKSGNLPSTTPKPVLNTGQTGVQPSPKPLLNNEQTGIQPTPRPVLNIGHTGDQPNSRPVWNIGQNGNQPNTQAPKPSQKNNIHGFPGPVTGNVQSNNSWRNKIQLSKPNSPIPGIRIRNNVSNTITPALHQEHKSTAKPNFRFPAINRPNPLRLNITKPKLNKINVITTSKPKIVIQPITLHQNKTKPTFNNMIARPKSEGNTKSKPKNIPTITKPFEIQKIEPLQSKGLQNSTNMSRKYPGKKLTVIPKGCFPGEIMSEMTLENGLDSGNYTKLGKTTLMDSCISKCCEIKTCEIALQMDNICFAIKCHSKETCKIKTTLGKKSHHNLCFISRTKKERQSTHDFDDDLLGTEDICPDDKAIGLRWKKTIAGTYDEIPCPKRAKGKAKRKCSIESLWLSPDFSDCVTSDYEELYKRAKRLVYGEDVSSLLQSLSVVTTRTIDNSLIFGGDLKKTTEIMTSIVQEQSVTQNSIGSKNLQNYLVTCSNLLDDSNKQEWANVQKKTSGSADILRDSQKFAILASSNLQHNVTHVTNNILVQMNYVTKRPNEMTVPDYSNPETAVWDGEKDNIRIPASIMNLSDTKIVTFSYKTLPALLPMKTSDHFSRSEPNSKILGISIEPHIQDKITPPVTITLHHLKEGRVNPRCVFWDFNLNPSKGGDWSTKGCWLGHSEERHSVCCCNHLSNYALLMDVVDDNSMQVTSKDQLHTREMAVMWICVPVLVVLIIGALYTAFTWSRRPMLHPRSLNEKSSLLRSSITTQEIRYDYSSSPSRYAGSSPKYKELEWQHEFGEQDSFNEDDIFRQCIQYKAVVQDNDSGIESNEFEESATLSEASMSQDTLTPEDESIKQYFSTNKEMELLRRLVRQTPRTSSLEEISHIRLEAEKRVFSSNLRRSTAINDLSL